MQSCRGGAQERSRSKVWIELTYLKGNGVKVAQRSWRPQTALPWLGVVSALEDPHRKSRFSAQRRRTGRTQEDERLSRAVSGRSSVSISPERCTRMPFVSGLLLVAGVHRGRDDSRAYRLGPYGRRREARSIGVVAVARGCWTRLVRPIAPVGFLITAPSRV